MRPPGHEDLAGREGSDEVKRKAFDHAFHEMEACVNMFTSLRLEQLDRMSLQQRLDEIGRG